MLYAQADEYKFVEESDSLFAIWVNSVSETRPMMLIEYLMF